jgi:hypothetical protein
MAYGIRLCSFTTVPDVQRGKWRWEFSEQFGPTFLGKNGDPLKNQPVETSPAWKEFNKWLEEYRAGQRTGADHV